MSGAQMYRFHVGQVFQAGKYSFIQDNGFLQGAVPASGNRYLFSEHGAGMCPLVLIGSWHEVINFFCKHEDHSIHNIIKKLPDIYMGACLFRKGERFKGLFPVHDTIQQLTEKTLDFVPGNNITDVAGGLAAMAQGIKDRIRGRKPQPKPTLQNTPAVVTFTYIEKDDVQLVARERVSFRDLKKPIIDALSNLVS